jgi:sugar phosphate isomerase/epimerase
VKLSVQESVLPGDAFSEKVALAETLGFDGIEIWGHSLPSRMAEIKSALRGRRITVSTICAGPDGALLMADPARRQKCRADTIEILKCAADLGAVGLIVVPAFNDQFEMPDLSPYQDAQTLGDHLLIAQLREMAGEIESLGGPCVLLEALNRYEAGYMCRQERAAQIARQVDSPAVRIMCDLFHMNIDETDTPATLKNVADVCSHIHLADNTRLEPGTGTIDFAAAISQLKQQGYQGYLALECGLSGDAEQVLGRCVRFLRGMIDSR